MAVIGLAQGDVWVMTSLGRFIKAVVNFSDRAYNITYLTLG
jgi:hypothetical protein